jgi:hypothetical protein
MPDPDRRPNLWLTIAILVVGLLILIPSGLCTGIFTIYPIVQFMMNPHTANPPLDFFQLALLVGGPFVLLGGFLVWLGISRLRRRRR